MKRALIPSFALAELVLQLATATRYGYFRDELYYLASTEHLAWGYVDHPPLSIFLLRIVRGLLGDSLVSLRLVPALAGACTVALTGLLCRRLGGGPFAQALAMLSALAAIAYLGTFHVYSMNALEALVWAGAALLLVRLFQGGDRKLWIVLGVVLGLGLLNKISVLWLGFGLLLGMRMSRAQRAWYMTPWPWLAGAIAFALFTPHLLWQVAHGWPTLEFMRNAARSKMTTFSPWAFLGWQVLIMNPVTLPVWTAGLGWLLLARHARSFRPLGTIYFVVLGILLAWTSRPSYLAPAYPPLLAAGGVAIESFVARFRLAWLRPTALALVALGGIALAPLGLPVLPVDTYIRYAKAIGVAPSTAERQRLGALPQHYADMQGWDAIVDAVARGFESLPENERAHAGIFAQNYGEAGAIDVLGARRGLPHAMSGHNSYWLWGPDPRRPETLVVLGGDEADNREVCGELVEVARTACGQCMPYENDLPVYICRELKIPLEELWPRLKEFI